MHGTTTASVGNGEAVLLAQEVDAERVVVDRDELLLGVELSRPSSARSGSRRPRRRGRSDHFTSLAVTGAPS